ncbi:MAG: rhomboid family intramembrane serine protease [Candidatus Sulfobium sp.]|jgi:membrane associated rhomboid family serine protease
MIPLSDADRRPVRFPLITVLIIGANSAVFLLELMKGRHFILSLSYIPAHIVGGRDLLTIITAMFVHAGWLHILGNMVYFWAFAPEIEDVMGRWRFAVFYLVGGIVASLVQIGINPASTLPNLGASGAIAAVMGAFLITFPRDRIRTIVILGFFVIIPFIPAMVLVGIWFVLQLFMEAGSVMAGQTGGVAHMAHIGGFSFGLLTARIFETSRKRSGGRGTGRQR